MEQASAPTGGGHRRAVVGLVIAAVVVVVVVALILTVRPSGRHDGAATSPSASASSTPFPQATPMSPRTTATAIATGVRVSITKVEHVEGAPTGSGEVKGPALRLTIAVTNGGTGTVDLGLAVINAFYGASLSPANTFEDPGGKPFAGTLTTGQTGTAVVLFAIPTSELGDVTVSVDYAPGQPAATFHGSFA